MTQPQDKMRAEFEAHMVKLNACVRLSRQIHTTGEYRTVSVQRNWELWQAACAQQSAQASQDALDSDGQIVAWMTEDGDRVVSAFTMAGARKDGGAILSGMKPYSVPLVRAAAQGASNV